MEFMTEEEFNNKVTAAIDSKFQSKHGESINQTFQDELEKDVPDLHMALSNLVNTVMGYYKERVMIIESLRVQQEYIAELEKEIKQLKGEH